MTMGTLMKENGVLKLVHPGGFVEIHNESITAAEVMKKNPRHCVTRPDVFKFPWVVVRPESILNPGRVFFIVPNHTIYRLLQAYGPQRPHQQLLKQTSQVESWPEVTPKNQEPNRSLKQRFNVKFWNEVASKYRDPVVNQENYLCPKQKSDQVQSWANHDECLEQLSSAESWTEVKCKRQYRNGCLRQKTPVESPDEVTPKHQDNDQCLNLQSLIETWTVTPKQLARDRLPKQQYPVESWPEVNAKHQEYKNFNQESLKSCLKKHKENGPQSRRLRVTFVLPGEDDEQRTEKLANL